MLISFLKSIVKIFRTTYIYIYIYIYIQPSLFDPIPLNQQVIPIIKSHIIHPMLLYFFHFFFSPRCNLRLYFNLINSSYLLFFDFEFACKIYYKEAKQWSLI